MATSRPVSTISYNTKEYLIKVLNKMLQDKEIQTYRVIFHYGERKADADDMKVLYDKETGIRTEVPKYSKEEDKFDKDHYHVWIMPNKKLDLIDVRKNFEEPVPGNKPLGCMVFYPSDEYNWLLYAIHDHDYLLAHDSETEDGKIPYNEDEVYSPDPFCTEMAFRRARVKQQTDTTSIIKSLKRGIAPAELVSSGKNPVQVYSLCRIYNLDKSATLLQRITCLELALNKAMDLLKTKYSLNVIYKDDNQSDVLPEAVVDDSGEEVLNFKI